MEGSFVAEVVAWCDIRVVVVGVEEFVDVDAVVVVGLTVK